MILKTKIEFRKESESGDKLSGDIFDYHYVDNSLESNIEDISSKLTKKYCKGVESIDVFTLSPKRKIIKAEERSKRIVSFVFDFSEGKDILEIWVCRIKIIEVQNE